MLDKFELHSSNQVDVIQFNTDNLPLRRVEFEIAARTTDRPFMQRHGMHQTHTYFGNLLIHTEGDIFGTDSADFNARKFNLVKKLLGINPGEAIQSNKLIGTLYIRFTGMPEDYTAAVTLDGFPTIPMEGLSPSRAPFQITYKSFRPYMYGAVSGLTHWVA